MPRSRQTVHASPNVPRRISFRKVVVWMVVALGLTCTPVLAETTQVRPQPRGTALAAELADALRLMRQDDWAAALRVAGAIGPVARDVIEWHRLRAGLGSYQDASAFLDRRADWPGLPYLRRQSEEALPLSVTRADTAQSVVAFFGAAQPSTGRGAVALIDAYRVLGTEGEAQAQAALAWLELPLSATTEARLLAIYPEVLADLNAERLDAMLWQGATNAAQRAIARVPTELAILARARLALRADSNVDAAIASVPKSLADDPGLAYERFRWRLSKGRRDSAVALLLERSVSPEALGQPDRWSRSRRDLARRAMREGRPTQAYEIASSHFLDQGSDYTDLEWLAGYISLTYLDAPARAVTHFENFLSRVATPISLGRAGYWLGRAHAETGDADMSQAAYRFGARYQTSFYGLLAAEAVGVPLDPSLAGREDFPDWREAGFHDSSVLEAALLLHAAGARDLAERFVTHLTESLDRPQIGALGDLVLGLGEPHLAVMIGKRAAQAGITVPAAYYPIVDLGVGNIPVAPELALAIARRESEFDPSVSSSVGARGLMQLMPDTAREVAGDLGLPYSASRLFSDPSYNATLGTEYLAQLQRRFGQNPILVAAGYNAGPSRPQRWIAERGDPRRDDVDIIDWIEHIPFSETRNYVMRVAESLPIYRARLTGQTGPLSFLAEISAR